MVSTWRIVLAALVIFGAGVLTGAVSSGLATRVAREHRTLNRPPGAGPARTNNVSDRGLSKVRPPGSVRLEQMVRLTKDLGLSVSQQAALDRLAGDTEARLREIWKPVLPEAKAEVDGFSRKLQEILTQEQRSRLAQAIEKRVPPKS